MTAIRIDPNELTPSNPEGAATSLPTFYTDVIAAINDHADGLDAGGVSGFLTPEQFGARGDGVTDDLAAFKSMIASASALGGAAEIRLGPKTYILGRDGSNSYSLDVVASNLMIRGEVGVTWLKHPTGMPATSVALVRIDKRSNVTIRDVGFDGNWGNATTIITASSDDQALPQATINVEDTTGFPSSGTFSVVLTTGTQVITYTGKTGAAFTGCTGGTGTLFYGRTVGYVDAQDGINHSTQSDPKNYLLMIRGSSNVLVENCQFRQAYGDFIWLGYSSTDGNKWARNIRIRNCTGDMSARNGISIGQAVDGVYVDGCRFTSIYGQAFDTEPVDQPAYNVQLRSCYLDTWWNPARNVINSPLSIAGGKSTAPSAQNVARGYRVKDCYIRGSVLIQDAEDVTIEGCDIIANWAGSSYAPVLMQMYCDGIRILNNYVYDRTSDGSGAGQLHRAAIQASVYSSGNYNGQPAGVVVRGNRIDARNGQAGILASGTGGGAYGLTTAVADVTGTASAITATTLTDSGAAWTVNEFIGFKVRVGAAWATIVANTSTQLTLLTPTFFATAWIDFRGSAMATPAAGTYQITTARAVFDVSDNVVDCSDDGYGQGGVGVWISGGRAGTRATVHRNRIKNAQGDAVLIQGVTSPDRTMAYVEVTDNKAFDDQATPTCSNAVRFILPNLITKLILRGNTNGDGVANAVSGLSAGTWLVYDGVAPMWAGFGSPETVVTAPVGAMYRRVDGGAGTCLYIKESGTSNTGWVAK